MFLQLGAIDLIKLEGIVDDAVAEVLVALDEFFDLDELVRVVDEFLQELRAILVNTSAF